MEIDPKDVAPFLPWLPWAALTWLQVVVCVAAAVTAFAWLIAVVRRGPATATRTIASVAWGVIVDLACLSPRRVWALARLSIQESLRRRVVVVFAVFIVILLFAGWFLDPSSTDPARLYLDFVLTGTAYLVLLLVLFLSSLSLPADLKNRTLYTVVTKPVRASEVVLGRIVGFMAVGTLLLAVMGAISYVFVVRGMNHTHALRADDLQRIAGAVAGQPATLEGKTSGVLERHYVYQHWHKATIDAEGEGHVAMEQKHWHKVESRKEGGKTTYRLGPPEDMLLARVPVYGKLTFRDQAGQPADKGSNVGDEWTYRGYIEGATLAACVWTFEDVTKSAFPNGLPLEMTIEVFRTYKGDIEKGVTGSLSVRNPTTGRKAQVLIFESKDFTTDVHLIPRDLELADGTKADLFRDFVDKDGRIELWLQCVEPKQYFGAAQGDAYLRARDASFAGNFVKGYLGTWLQMLLVVSLGVFFSTFLSGPVAILATVGALIGGLFKTFMLSVAAGPKFGGGPFESIIRILTQENMTSPLEPGLRATLAQTLDRPAESLLGIMARMLPDFGRFNFAEYVASGFNISGDTILTSVCKAFAYALPVFVAAYLCLKTREVGK